MHHTAITSTSPGSGSMPAVSAKKSQQPDPKSSSLPPAGERALVPTSVSARHSLAMTQARKVGAGRGTMDVESRPAGPSGPDALSLAHHTYVMLTSHRHIDTAKFEALVAVSQMLKGLSHPARMKAAEQYFDQVHDTLDADTKAVFGGLRREVLSLQLASLANTSLVIAPAITGGVTTGLPAAIGVLVWQVLQQFFGPYIGVQIFNAAFYGVEDRRQGGMPGRSRHMEAARSLKDTKTGLDTTSTALERSIATARTVGLVEGAPAPQEAMVTLTMARNGSKDALEARYLREVLDDSYGAGRQGQFAVAVLRQTLFYLSQYIGYSQRDKCDAGRVAFYVTMGAVGVTQLLQIGAALTDRPREARRITAGNIGYSPLNTKADLRLMYREPCEMLTWRVNDGVENRADAALDGLAKQFNVSVKRIKQFEQAGGFDQTQFSAPPEEGERLYAEILTRSEGTPVVKGAGMEGEVARLAVLEDLQTLHMLEDLGKLGVLEALNKAHARKSPDGADPAEGATFVPSRSEVRNLLGLGSDHEAQALLDGPLPPQRLSQLADLKTKYGQALSAVAAPRDLSDDLQITGPGTATYDVEIVRATLGLESIDAAQKLLDGPAAGATSVLGRLGGQLASLKTKYEADKPYEQLRDVLGLPSLDAAKALRNGLTHELRDQFIALERKYETRQGLSPADFMEVSRERMLQMAEMARAYGGVLSEQEELVLQRWGGFGKKAASSSLDLREWRNPYDSGSPEEDASRRYKSLTPFEHARLLMLQVRPRRNEGESTKAGHVVTHHDMAALKVSGAPKSMDEVHRLLRQLRDSRLDKAMLPWDWTRLSPATTSMVRNQFLGARSAAGNTLNAVTTRWNMAGYVIPLLTVQFARTFFWGIGGSAFFFVLTAALGLIRKAHPDTFKCEPGKGPSEAAMKFTYIAMGISTVQFILALANTWPKPHAVNTGRVRTEYFRSPGGRPTLFQMIGRYFPEAAFTLVPRAAVQRGITGPLAKRRAERLVAEADRQLVRLAGLASQPAEPAPRAAANTITLLQQRDSTRVAASTAIEGGSSARYRAVESDARSTVDIIE